MSVPSLSLLPLFLFFPYLATAQPRETDESESLFYLASCSHHLQRCTAEKACNTHLAYVKKECKRDHQKGTCRVSDCQQAIRSFVEHFSNISEALIFCSCDDHSAHCPEKSILSPQCIYDPVNEQCGFVESRCGATPDCKNIRDLVGRVCSVGGERCESSKNADCIRAIMALKGTMLDTQCKCVVEHSAQCMRNRAKLFPNHPCVHYIEMDFKSREMAKGSAISTHSTHKTRLHLNHSKTPVTVVPHVPMGGKDAFDVTTPRASTYTEDCTLTDFRGYPIAFSANDTFQEFQDFAAQCSRVCLCKAKSVMVCDDVTCLTSDAVHSCADTVRDNPNHTVGFGLGYRDAVRGACVCKGSERVCERPMDLAGRRAIEQAFSRGGVYVLIGFSNREYDRLRRSNLAKGQSKDVIRNILFDLNKMYFRVPGASINCALSALYFNEAEGNILAAIKSADFTRTEAAKNCSKSLGSFVGEVLKDSSARYYRFVSVIHQLSLHDLLDDFPKPFSSSSAVSLFTLPLILLLRL